MDLTRFGCCCRIPNSVHTELVFRLQTAVFGADNTQQKSSGRRYRTAGGLIMKGGALVMKTPNNFVLIEFHLVKEMAKYFRKWFRKRTKHKQKKGSNVIFQVPKDKQER